MKRASRGEEQHEALLLLGDDDENLIGTQGLGIVYPEDEAFASHFSP